MNKKYKDADVKFEVRNIYFISTDQKDIKKDFVKDEDVLTLGVDSKTNKSSLLANFDKAATANSKGAANKSFNVLLASLKESGSGEPGRGQEPGNTTAADISSAFKTVNQGQILIHELGHNLGLPHKTYTSGMDAHNHGMSATLPDRRPGNRPGINTKSDPSLTAEEINTVKTRIKKGTYNDYKKVVKTSLAPTDGSGELGPQYATNLPANTFVPANTSQPVSFNPTASDQGLGPTDPSVLSNLRTWEFRTGFDVGDLDRESTGTLGTDNGVAISPRNLFFLSNDDLVDYYWMEAVHRFIWGETLWGMHMWYKFGSSGTDEQIGLIPVGPGNNLLIFSPQGVDGGLGGGLNAGPRDAQDVHYKNNYDSHEFGGLIQGTILDGQFYSVSGGPSVSYGRQEVKERIHGYVSGLNQTFTYDNAGEVTTYSLGGRLDVKVGIGTLFGAPLTFNGGASYERQFHDTDGHSGLDLRGLINAAEHQYLDGTDQTNRFQFDAGLSVKITESLDLSFGGSFRKFYTPRIQLLPEQVATFELDESDEVTGFVRAVFSIGKPVHKSPTFDAIRSDRRLKRDITHLKTLGSGIRLYSFKYLWDDAVHVGVMAQDILAMPGHKDAVHMDPSGFFSVDYGRLGLRMTTLAAWHEWDVAAVLHHTPASISARARPSAQ